MKILLISSYNLPCVSRTDMSPPLNLLYIAAALQSAGYSPVLLDLNLVNVPREASGEKQYLKAIEESLINNSPSIVGFSCLTSGHFPFVRIAAILARKILPDTKIMVGGVHATLFSREIMEHCPEIDFVIVGEGEIQTIALAQEIEKKGSDFSGILALGWRQTDGSVIINPRKNYITRLDTLRLPAWDMVDFSRYYRDHPTWYNPKSQDIRISIPILTTRGCPYNCNFCSAYETMGRGYRRRSPERVVDEIEYHVREYGHRYFGIVDDNFTLDKHHVLAVCGEIRKRGLDIQFESFNGYNLASLDEEVVSALALAGCVYAILPIEHGNDRMRNEIIGKRLPREKIFEVMDLYRKYGIQTRTMFIMGFPEDTPETLEDTRRMIEELSPDMADVFTLIPFPGTKVYRQAYSEKLFIHDINERDLWQGNLPLDTKGSEFYLKPYEMSMEELATWRKTFNEITAKLLSKREKVIFTTRELPNECK